MRESLESHNRQPRRGPGRACPSPGVLLVSVALGLCAGCSRTPESVSNVADKDEPGKPWIMAVPNPVPAGRGPGRTNICWDTGDGSAPEVYLSVNGGPEKLFSRLPTNQDATQIGKDRYEFRLYGGAEGKKLLAKVQVRRNSR